MKTGYEVTLRDFERLTSDPYCLPMVAPLLRKWFGYEIEVVGPPPLKSYEQKTVIRDTDGHIVDRNELHRIIQEDPEMQGSLYRTSQTLWR